MTPLASSVVGFCEYVCKVCEWSHLDVLHGKDLAILKILDDKRRGWVCLRMDLMWSSWMYSEVGYLVVTDASSSRRFNYSKVVLSL
jgi:hypothetical protein